MNYPCCEDRWARAGILAQPRESRLSLPEIRERVVHVQVDERSAAILFATVKDAKNFITFCDRYLEACNSHEPYETYLRPNDSGVSHADVVHLSLSHKFLTRMLSRLKASLCFKKCFQPNAESNRVIVNSPTTEVDGVQFHFDGESILVGQPKL